MTYSLVNLPRPSPFLQIGLVWKLGDGDGKCQELTAQHIFEWSNSDESLEFRWSRTGMSL
jgi:hypothetical protein